MKCPACKSENIRKLDFYLSEKKRSVKGVNILILLLILIFFPLGLILFATVAIGYFLWPALLVLAVFLFIIRKIKERAQANLFICLVCGTRFPLVFDAPAKPAKRAKSSWFLKNSRFRLPVDELLKTFSVVL